MNVAISPWISTAAADVAPLLFDAVAKSVVLLSVTLLLSAALGSYGSASRRHWVLLVGVASLLALPFLSLVLPKWRVLPVAVDSLAAVRQVEPAVIAESPALPMRAQIEDIRHFDAPTPERSRVIAEPRPTAVATYVHSSDPVETAVTAPSANTNDAGTRPGAPGWPAILVLVWIGGVFALLARLAAARWRLTRFTSRSTPIGNGIMRDELDSLCGMLAIRRTVRLRISDARPMPMMWGIFRSSILLPSDCRLWTTLRLRTVLLHELAHVKRRDTLAQLIVQVASALYWFNPLVWLATWRVRVERERACDDLVLSHGTKASDYAEHLLAVATGFDRPRVAQAAVLAMAQRLRIEGRLLAILDAAIKRSGISRRAALASVVAAAAVLMPIAMMHAENEQNPTSPDITASNKQDQKQKSAETKNSKADSEAKRPPAEVKVAGRIVDEGGHPVAGAEVVALVRKDRRFVKSSTDGRFDLSVPLKELAGLMIVARHQQGARQAFHMFSYEQALAPKEPVSLVLHEAREIEANIADAADNPVAGAWVVAVSRFEKLDEAKTGANGKAVLRVPADAPLMYVAAAKPGVGLDYFAFRQMDRPRSDPYQLAQDHRDPLRFVLNGKKTVSVRVVDANKQPMRGVTVYPWYFEKPNKGAGLNSGLEELNAITDDRGIATLSNIPADNTVKVTLGVIAKGYVAPERPVWDPKSGVNELAATLLPMVKVRGSAKLPDGRPAADIEIGITGGGHHDDTFHGSAHTDAQGKFEVLVNPDEYYMLVPRNERWAAPAQHFIVRQQQRDGVDFVLQPATRVYGRVTIGPNHAPWTDGYLQLYQKGADYYKLPNDQRLPNPTASSRAVYTLSARNTKTDADGRFEFFAGPGSFYITGPDNIKAPIFDLTDERDREVNIELPGPDRGEITGRVVFKDDPTRGAAEARLTGRPTSSRSSFLGAITDDAGRFTTIGGLSGMQVHAVTSDGKQAGIVRLPEGETTLEINVAPLASARGRLLDEATGEPLAGSQIDYGVRVIYTDNSSLSSVHFGGSTTTDERGQFVVNDVVVGWEYTISVVTEADGKGQPRSWYHVAKFTAKDANVAPIGDIFYKTPARPLTVEERITNAFGKKESLNDRLRDRQRDARLGHQRVLLIASDPKSDLCRQFYDLFYDDENRDVSRQMANYLLLPLDTAAKDVQAEARAFTKRIGLDWPAADNVTLAAISEDGKLIASLSCREIADGGRLDRQRLSAFLAKLAPEMPDAEQLLAAELARAKREDKRLLVQESGAYCAPCIRLSRFLDEHRELIAKEYVYLSLDKRFKNGEAVISRFGKKEGGIPWMVVLDSAGNPLITSDGPDGNIGFPTSPEGRTHFEKMLRNTARHLSEPEIRKLLDALAAAAS